MDGMNLGVEVQETAAPVATENPEAEVNTDSAEVETEGTEADGATETEESNGRTEEDSRFANVRRKAEEDARNRYNAERSRLDGEIKRLFGEYTHPETGKSIETMEEYISAIEAQQRQQQNEELRSRGIDPSMIENMINNSPAVRNANAIMEQNAMNEANRRLEADLKEVMKMDPSIKSADDLAKHESYPKIVDLVGKHGLSLVDAYYLANRQAISNQSREAAKQAAINQVRGKDHLDPTSGVATNESKLDIPQAEIAKWREYFPGLSDAQLKEKYNATL